MCSQLRHLGHVAVLVRAVLGMLSAMPDYAIEKPHSEIEPAEPQGVI